MDKLIDLTNHLEMQEDIIRKTVLCCTIRLDRQTIINVLSSDSIHINGKYYEVPESKLLECFINKRYGAIRLELMEINIPTKTK